MNLRVVTDSELSVVIAVRGGADHSAVVAPLHESISRIGSIVTSSRLEETLRADAVVVVDGWDDAPLLAVPAHCQQRFAAPALFAILHDSSHSIAEVLDSGFDHCARWPIQPLDIAASLRATLRRARTHPASPTIQLDSFELRVRCGEVEATLTKGQFAVLNELLREPPRWTTSRDLLTVTSGTRNRDTTQIRNHILALRRKLGTEGWRIRWHRSLGYCFDLSRSP